MADLQEQQQKRREIRRIIRAKNRLSRTTNDIQVKEAFELYSLLNAGFNIDISLIDVRIVDLVLIIADEQQEYDKEMSKKWTMK